MSRNAGTMKAKHAIWIGVIFIVIGGAIVWWAGYLILRDKESKEWPTVEGVISASEMLSFKTTETERRNKGQLSSRKREVIVFSAEIAYTYTVDGKEYTSDNIEMGAETSKFSGDIKAKVEEYPKGKQVTVYYNPEDHNDAMLEVGFGPALYIPLAFGGFFLFMGLVGTGFATLEAIKDSKKKSEENTD
jgi:hypothetical protein